MPLQGDRAVRAPASGQRQAERRSCQIIPSITVSRNPGTIVAEARKYGISLILIQQYVGQGIGPDLMQNILTNTPLKITGAGTLSTYEKVAASQQVDREGFQGLRPRLFHVSPGGAGKR